jgi:hypothetical protein
MTEAITLDPTIRTGTRTSVAASVGATASRGVTTSPSVPAYIGLDEAYYWSFKWQQDVRESMAALAAGEYEDFDSDDPNDVARWLLSVDPGD